MTGPHETSDAPRVTLHLVRHAQAAERGDAWPDDADRPLVAKGHDQAERLARAFERQGVRFDRLFSSPYTRAAQTAAPLTARARRGGPPEMLDALAAGDPRALLAELLARLGDDDRNVALVGHEPWLGEFAAYLLTGDPDGVALRVRKASVTRLAGDAAPGAMRLEALLPMRTVKALTRPPS